MTIEITYQILFYLTCLSGVCVFGIGVTLVYMAVTRHEILFGRWNSYDLARWYPKVFIASISLFAMSFIIAFVFGPFR